MKKMIALALTLFCMMGLIGCNKGNAPGQDGSKTPIDEWEVTVSYAGWSEDASIFQEALNIKKMISSSVQHLPIFKVDTKQELEQFKVKCGATHAVNQSFAEVTSFEDATSKYDEAFFEDNSLLIVYVEADSGSLRFEVSDVYCENQSVCVHVKQANNPEILTKDLVGWFITVVIQDGAIRDCESYDADLNNPENSNV